MKTNLQTSGVLVAGAALLLTASIADARCYGVCRAPAGRGTVYTGSRGGAAYVGPRGVAAQGPEGRTAVATPRGAAVAGPNGAAVASRSGAAAAAANRNAYAAGYGYGYGYAPWTGVYVDPATVTAPLPPIPPGYVSTVPPGCTIVTYEGYSCYFVGGVHYRPVFYAGSTIYLIMH